MAEILKIWFPFLFLVCVPMLEGYAPPVERTSENTADILQKICDRLDAIERRLDRLEGRKTESAVKPVLEIQIAKYGSPQSDALAEDIKRLGLNRPVEIRYRNFSEQSPAFRWTDEDGNTKTQVGYKARTLHKVIQSVTGKKHEIEYDEPIFGNG